MGLDERMREDPYNWCLDTFENSIFKPMQTVLKHTTEGEKSRIQKEALAATRRLWSLVTEAVLDRMDARLS